MNQAASAMSEFFSEAQEILERVHAGLPLMEKRDQAADSIHSMYRDIHTLKGSSQLFGFQILGKLLHAMETSLEPFRRDHGKQMTEGLMSALTQCLDLVDRISTALKNGQSESTYQSYFLTVLARLIDAAVREFGNDYDLSFFVQSDSVLSLTPTPPSQNFQRQSSLGNTDLVQTMTIQVPVHEGMATTQAAQPISDSTIRVSVHLLDKLMNLVGELVLVRNQMLQHSSDTENLDLLNLSQNLNTVTSELQSEVMKTRMQPIGSIFAKFQRVVRDIASSLGKNIEISFKGAETELDKTLLEAIKDPLTHIIRNSCDHGVEGPEDRQKAGKARHGTILIQAFHEGGQVVIEIIDDGRGLNYQRIGAKALEKNLITAERLAQLKEREIANLIFAPGFSTAETVTSVSGRGVGMDVVKTNIEKIGGTVDLDSVFGKGMTIRLRIPLTLAIVPAMMIRSGDQRFAIPQVKLVQLVRIEKDATRGPGIEMLQGKPFYRLRGQLLPLMSLKELLGDQDSKVAETELRSSEILNLVVLGTEGAQFGLVVDQILDAGDIVVKPVSQFIKSLDAFSGATIFGDGSVGLILDVSALSRRVLGERLERSSIDQKRSLSDEDALALGRVEPQEMLLFRTRAREKYAIPLCLVTRLEEFRIEAIEHSGEQSVVRYRESILPLIRIDGALGLAESDFEVALPSDSAAEVIPVIVVTQSGRQFGLEVDSILDIVTITESVDQTLKDRVGIFGTTVYESEIIVVVDLFSLIEKRFAGAMASDRRAQRELRVKPPVAIYRKLRILVAEPTVFFRQQLQQVLEDEGHEVIVAKSGDVALALLDQPAGPSIDLLICNLYLPRLGSLELLQQVRKNAKFKSLKILALSSGGYIKDFKHAEESGFDSCIEKLDSEALFAQMGRMMGGVR